MNLLPCSREKLQKKLQITIMRDMIVNIRDVTDHATKMAFFVEYHGKQQISQSERRRGAEFPSYSRPWLIMILGKIRGRFLYPVSESEKLKALPI